MENVFTEFKFSFYIKILMFLGYKCYVYLDGAYEVSKSPTENKPLLCYIKATFTWSFLWNSYLTKSNLVDQRNKTV